MRFLIVDMHRINFLVRTYSMLKVDDRIVKAKHRFLIDYALKEGIPICDYITRKGCSIRGARYLSKVFGWKALVQYETKYVLRKNYPNINIDIIDKAEEIKDDDIVIGYFFDELTRSVFAELPGHKVLMSNHFVAINDPVDLTKWGVEAFVSEINLDNNEFVNRYIKHDNVKMITCPYTFADRFCNKHQSRKNKLFAVGTLSTCKNVRGYKLYREMFNTEWIQIMRKEIFEKSDKYPSEIDSYISYILEDKLVIKPTDLFIVKKYKKWKNKHSIWTQRKYESFDMVEKFNEYLFFACPEELVGMPGIGFVEGMACGTAYIGIDVPYYRDLGLIPGVHYISYDCTMNGLIDTIHYCMKHIDEVKAIAERGESFVRKHFNQETVAKSFIDDLKSLIAGE